MIGENKMKMRNKTISLSISTKDWSVKDFEWLKAYMVDNNKRMIKHFMKYLEKDHPKKNLKIPNMEVGE
jgi:hypothetical protein